VSTSPYAAKALSLESFIGIVLRRSRALFAGVHIPGHHCSINARAPVTCGAAMLVPQRRM
jgi:hypothetical protein